MTVIDHAHDRTLDLDLLLLGPEVTSSRSLTLPHPRMHQRAFVLVPACEVAANWTHPVHHQTLEQLLAALPQTDVLNVLAGQRPAPEAPYRLPLSLRCHDGARLRRLTMKTSRLPANPQERRGAVITGQSAAARVVTLVFAVLFAVLIAMPAQAAEWRKVSSESHLDGRVAEDVF